MTSDVTLHELDIVKLDDLKKAFVKREGDLAKAMRRVPVLPEAPTMGYQEALMEGIPSATAQQILDENFSSRVTAAKIIHTANIINLMFSRTDFEAKQILEIGPGQFSFSLLATALGGSVTVLDKNNFFIDVAKALNFNAYHLDYYICSGTEMPLAFDGLWLKGSFSPLLPGGPDAIEGVAHKITNWIRGRGWGFVAPNAKSAKFQERFGSGFELEMERLIETQRTSMENLGWTSISLNEKRRRYLGLASAAYDASRYLFLKNLDFSSLREMR